MGGVRWEMKGWEMGWCEVGDEGMGGGRWEIMGGICGRWVVGEKKVGAKKTK